VKRVSQKKSEKDRGGRDRLQSRRITIIVNTKGLVVRSGKYAKKGSKQGTTKRDGEIKRKLKKDKSKK